KTYPHKPVMVLEFGDWLPFGGSEDAQRQAFRKTYPAFASNLDIFPAGYVGSAVWWSLQDYWTDVPGIVVERFGLFRPDGGIRAVGVDAQTSFGRVTTPVAAQPRVVSGGQAVAVPVPEPSHFATHLAFDRVFPCGDRIGDLQTVQDDWFIVIPLAAVALGLVGALIGALTGALVAATYGSLLGSVEVVVEEATGAERTEPVKRVRRRRARRSTD